MHFYNGKYVTEENLINITDRGFLLGDGVFTTLRVVKGKPLFLRKHLDRLNSNLKAIYIDVELDESETSNICNKLIQENSFKNSDGIIRITLTRGAGGRGITLPPKNQQKPTLLIRAMPYHEEPNTPLKLCVTNTIRNEKSIISKIKSLNYMDSILARQEAINRGFNDGIMLNSKNLVTECSVSNIFFITNDGTVVTPPISDGVLPGIVRSVVLNICKQLNIKIAEQSIKVDDLRGFESAFVTNSAIGIRAVELVDIKCFDCNVKTLELIQNGYLSLVEAESS